MVNSILYTHLPHWYKAFSPPCRHREPRNHPLLPACLKSRISLPNENMILNGLHFHCGLWHCEWLSVWLSGFGRLWRWRKFIFLCYNKISLIHMNTEQTVFHLCILFGDDPLCWHCSKGSDSLTLWLSRQITTEFWQRESAIYECCYTRNNAMAWCCTHR